MLPSVPTEDPRALLSGHPRQPPASDLGSPASGFPGSASFFSRRYRADSVFPSTAMPSCGALLINLQMAKLPSGASATNSVLS